DREARPPLRLPSPRARGRPQLRPAAQARGLRRLSLPGHEVAQPQDGGAGDRADQLLPRQQLHHHPPGGAGGFLRGRARAHPPRQGTNPPHGPRLSSLCPGGCPGGRVLPRARNLWRAGRGAGRRGDPAARAGDSQRDPSHQARAAAAAAHRLARAGGHQRLAAGGGPPRPPGDPGLPARLLRPHHPGDRHDRDLSRSRLGPAGGLSLQRQQPAQRGDEGAHHHLDHLHTLELHRRRLRHELQPRGEPAQHAGAQLVLRLSLFPGADGGRRRRAGALLPPQGLVLRGAVLIPKKSAFLPGLLLWALAAQYAGAADAPETLKYGRLGTVTLYRQSPHPRHVVLFLSGDGGWNQGVVDMAWILAGMDSVVAGIDLPHYLRQLAVSREACSYPAADLEALSKLIQKKLGFASYEAPVLVGYSSGATLVYAALVQAPPNTFRGAISMGFCPDLPLRHPFCEGHGLKGEPGPKGKGISFLPAANLEQPW